MKAIALLEVQAMVAAITGLDAMVKAADVRLIHVEKRLGGRLVTVVVEGEVSAVRAARTAETSPSTTTVTSRPPSRFSTWISLTSAAFTIASRPVIAATIA